MSSLLVGVALGNIARGIPLDASGEYAGNFFRQGSSIQIMDFGVLWRPKKRHQVDFRFGYGLSREASRAFVGFGYSVLVGRILPWGRR